jgi:hypothetical protein
MNGIIIFLVYNGLKVILIYSLFSFLLEFIIDAGFRVGVNTPYRYVVIHIQYLASAINDTYGQQIIITHTK